MKSVLHLISGGDAGGAKTHLYALMQGLQGRVHTKVICFIKDTFYRQGKELGLDIEVVEQRSRFDIRVMKEVSKKAREMHADILHCHGARANFNALFYKGDQVRVTTIHSDYLLDFKDNFFKDKIFTPLNSYALRKFDYYIAVTENFKKMLIDRGFPKDRIFVIYNGIDMYSQEEKVDPKSFYQRYGLEDNGKFTFGIVARLDANKDQKTMIEAFHKSGLKGKARVLIAGDGPEGHRLKERVKDYGLEEDIFFLGGIQDPYSLYQAIDVNVLCSLSESFPYALLEGAKEKRTAIASRIGGIPEMIRPGQDGYLFNPGDAQALKDILVTCYENQDQVKEMGQSFHQRVEEKFSVASMAKVHEEIYAEILRRGK